MKFTHRLLVLLCCTATCLVHYAKGNALYPYCTDSIISFDSIDYNAVVYSLAGENKLFENAFTIKEERVSIQLIQNVPAAAFDLYLNEKLIVRNLNFRTATPFLAFPKEESFRIGLAPANSSSAAEIMEQFDFKLDDELPYLLFINHDELEGNTLMQLRDRVPKNGTEQGLFISFAHGVFDLSPVDVFINGERKFSNVGAGEITPYFAIPNEPFQVDLRSIYTGKTLYSYEADLSSRAGQSAVLYISGLMEDQDFPLSMQVTLSDATTLTLSIKKEEKETVYNTFAEDASTAYIEETISSGNPKKSNEVTTTRGMTYNEPTQVFVEKRTIDVIIVIEQPDAVNVNLIDGEGKIVDQQSAEQLEKGKYFFDIHKKYLKSGLYDLQIQIGEKRFSHQILVAK
ncbi:MAG: hypothetical protein AAGG68_23140 [Bacteroidota bacterium]